MPALQLGGISQARRFNPAEFALRFARIFEGDAFLLTAPAIVRSAVTMTALAERGRLRSTLDLAETLDLVVLGVGGIAAGAPIYRTGFIGEPERHSPQPAGAVGDILFHFLDRNGRLVDHPIQGRIISADMEVLRRVPRRVVASGGPDKTEILHSTSAFLRPTTLVTDKHTAERLPEAGPLDASAAIR